MDIRNRVNPVAGSVANSYAFFDRRISLIGWGCCVLMNIFARYTTLMMLSVCTRTVSYGIDYLGTIARDYSQASVIHELSTVWLLDGRNDI